ncbi:Ctr-domain-containing protein [Rhizodiscina lignyota]|uniref:Copper transport protein n=1 Tax=Rhizodiscina lignyota TaxID=1504668 RepID=A0A9P4IMY9_9PEZI|nr:Ctr-domain-containing protein [Rhizodiscina lignyota]
MSSSMSMSVPMSSMAMSSTVTAASAAATSSASSMGGMDMGGMDMSTGSHACKISMLWNWYTVDSCFLASSWHNTSHGMFAGSCIGVICLVLTLEFLRRLGKEYDRFLVRQSLQQRAVVNSGATSENGSGAGLQQGDGKADAAMVKSRMCVGGAAVSAQFRPNVLQQGVRALLHMLQFAVAYFIMLLAMYFNGYIIICIFIGAFLGFFIFGWETVQLDKSQEEEVTVCCG